MLTDAELLAILLRIGVQGKSAVELGRELLQRFGSLQAMMSAPLSAWEGIKGLGTAKKAQLVAALELGRRAALPMGRGQYEAFLDELCVNREYQKEAIRMTMRYLLGGECKNLRELARENFDKHDILQQRYGSFAGMERHLQLPDQLSASVDLATGTGKSFVLYGIAAILLAEGAVDRVLLLCPSNTIEAGLLEKFRELAGRVELRDLLPGHAKIDAPCIITARESITEGSICIENYHAILEHVGSSIRDSLQNKGLRTAVLNDEVHHVANESQAKEKKWKTFPYRPQLRFSLHHWCFWHLLYRQ